jgi:hypothetical protein
MAAFKGLLVKVSGDTAAISKAVKNAFGLDTDQIEPILEIPAQPEAAKGLAPQSPAVWLRVKANSFADNPWDAAHAHLAPSSPFATGKAPNIQTIEPDLEQEWPFQRRLAEEQGMGFASGKRTFAPSRTRMATAERPKDRGERGIFL